MDDDQHPAIVDLKKRMGGTMASEVSDDAYVSEFLFQTPNWRAETLLQADKILESDDGSNLRKMAHLKTFRQKLRTVDYELRKANR